MMCVSLWLFAYSAVCNAQSNFTYKNTLEKIDKPLPIFADYPDYVEPLIYEDRFLAPPVVYDEDGEITVRSWRYWYNARGIIEMENRLDAQATAIINLIAWGVDDGQGLRSPDPSGIVLSGTPEKNAFSPRQVKDVINPFLDRLGKHVVLVGHTLSGSEDSVRKLLYPSMSTKRGELDSEKGTRMLTAALSSFTYESLQPEINVPLDSRIPLTGYFLETPSSHTGSAYNSPGFSMLPVPLVKGLVRGKNDIVFYDGDGYDKVRDYLKSRGVRHILVMGFIEKDTILPTHPGEWSEKAPVTDKIGTVCSIDKLRNDFNIFLVGDTMRTTFPGSTTPRFATQAALAKLSGEYMITQVGFVSVMKE